MQDLSIPLGPDSSMEFNVRRQDALLWFGVALKALWYGGQRVAVKGNHELVIKNFPTQPQQPCRHGKALGDDCGLCEL